TVAVGCARLPEPFHGKEGVSGSSPEEALTCGCSHVRWVLSTLWSSQDFTSASRVSKGAKTASFGFHDRQSNGAQPRRRSQVGIFDAAKRSERRFSALFDVGAAV